MRSFGTRHPGSWSALGETHKRTRTRLLTASSSAFIPQVVEVNSPQPMDVAEESLLYYDLMPICHVVGEINYELQVKWAVFT